LKAIPDVAHLLPHGSNSRTTAHA